MITIISQKFYLKLGIVIIYASFSESLAAAQLNLPPLPIFSTARPDIYPNSYAANRPNDRYNFDNDRSQRYGPPYRDDEEERYGDRRPNNNYDDRNRYNTGANDRDRNPFNNTYDRYKPNDGYRPENPYNQNPYNENPNTYNQNPFNDRDRNTYNNTYDRYKPNDRYGPDHPYNQNPYNQNPNTYNQNPYNSERYNQVLERLRHFLVDADHKGSIECTTNVGSQWNFETDVNEVTQAEALLAQQRYSDYLHIIWEELNKIDKDNIFDENLARQVKLLAAIGPSALPPDQLDRYNRVINDMLAIYNGATICEFERPFECGLRLQPHLKDIMAKSRDWNELQYVWSEYRRKSGKPMRDLFQQLIELMNDIAVANNYTSPTEYWFSAYETPNFRDEMQLVWSQIQPLYELLHAYVRRKLREYYGPDKINRNAPLPAHIFGNMYAQTWTNILDIIIPYPGRSFIDVTPRMLEQGYTPSIMFQLAEEFFLSMNMSALSPDFWVNSILEEPVNRPVLCQPSSWDFCTRHDFRIKMCTHVTHKDLINVHHEMAHIQYFLNYRHQPKVFRDGANPGFHEAIGDAIGLSVSTAKHLQTLGLVQKSVDDTSYDINFLFAMAVDKVVFLPYALTTEIWRADIFNRRVSKAEYNCYYWLLREQYSGIKPPILRSEIDFDPGAKYHIPANVPYMK